MTETRLFIDADACPVKAEAERVALRHGVRMFVVSNGGIRPSVHPLVESVFVPDGPDEADKWIADRAGPADVVVTGDIPLAARRQEGAFRMQKGYDHSYFFVSSLIEEHLGFHARALYD
jgi:uncharacterized protein YaiI (UPF0178 family)